MISNCQQFCQLWCERLQLLSCICWMGETPWKSMSVFKAMTSYYHHPDVA